MGIRIKELLYSQERAVTVAITSDGINYALPMLRDALLIAKWCRLVREGTWGMALSEEGMKLLLDAKDLQRNVMSF